MGAYGFSGGDSYADYDYFDEAEDALSLQESAAEKAAAEVALHTLAEEAQILWHAEDQTHYLVEYEDEQINAAHDTDFTDPGSVSQFLEGMTTDALLAVPPERIFNIVEEVTLAWGRALEVR